ncbi:MAG: hypothetical protein N3A38_16050, partial [Planctomycetota bacterium]|nr:hypothetical protein [Planctomycetota bacterium]
YHGRRRDVRVPPFLEKSYESGSNLVRRHWHLVVPPDSRLDGRKDQATTAGAAPPPSGAGSAAS